MLIKGTMAVAFSGSVAGHTAAHNAGGYYLRSRNVPTNPNTSFQRLVRDSLSSLVERWTQVLTEAQRAAWAVFASNVSVINRLGDAIHISGLSWYVKANVGRLQAGLDPVDDGPTVFALAGLSLLTASGFDDGPPSTVDVDIDNTDDWANETGGALLIYASRPQNPTINFFAGPYQLAGITDGNDTTPPTSPVTVTLPFDAVAGQRLFFRAVATRADGRPSAEQFFQLDAA